MNNNSELTFDDEFPKYDTIYITEERGTSNG